MDDPVNPGSATPAVAAGTPTAPAPIATPVAPSAAQTRADNARREAKRAWKAVHARLSVTRGAFDSFASSAQQAYDLALTQQPPSDRHFNRATKDWQKAAAVEIPTPAHTPEAELASVRGVAKEWLAAALALFGLFSFTALFFGGETLKVFADQSWLPVIIFALLALGAITGAVLCSFFGTRAAHGWPPRGSSTPVDENGKERRRTPLEKVDDARRDLKRAVYAAGGTVLAIVLALATVLFTQLAAPAPLQVEVMPKTGDTAIACGTYETGDAAGIAVTKKDDERVTTPWSDVGKVNAVRSC